MTGLRTLASALALLAAAPRLETAERDLPESRPARPLWSLAGVFGTRFLESPGPRMILIPSSTFRMGSTGEEIVDALVDCQREQRGPECDPATFGDEGPVRTVALSAYLLDRTEVTVLEYARCVAAGRCAAIPYSSGARRFERDDFPATLVTFHDALSYCAFRGARLPTEAEYERAARGPTGRRYPWGNLFSNGAANHGRFAWDPTDESDGFSALSPVGSFPSGRSREGIFDLAGNVAEWVSDRYAPEYLANDRVNPQGPPIEASSPSRVVRGGSYASAAPFLRAAARDALPPDTRRPMVGFRCARSLRPRREE